MKIRENRVPNNSKPTPTESKRIDLCVDESGQDTRGKLFVVAVVVIAAERSDEIRKVYEALEKSSGKGKVKWASAKKDKRLAYLQTAIQRAPSLDVKFFYCIFRQTTDYDGATVEGIARAINRLPGSVSRVYVHVDGLTEPKCSKYKRRLRQLGCRRVKDVRGVRKRQNEPLVRLADTMAGAGGEWEKHKAPDLEEIFSEAKRSGTLIKL